MRDSYALRRRAEQALNRGSLDGQALPTDVRELLRELQIHQIELEMQNEELRDAHVALEVARQKYFELYDLAPVGYLSLGVDSGVVEANRAAAAMVGMQPDELVGQRFSRMIDPAFAEEFARHFRAVLATETRKSCQIELQVPGRSRCEVRLDSVSAAADAGYALRMALIDITELNRLERELREAQKLEAIGSLASGVAHEFNNRLMAIVGCAEAAQSQLDPESPARDSLDQLKEAALRGRSITTRLLTFARRDESDEAAELDRAVTASVPLLRQILGERVRLEIDLAAPGARVCLSMGLIEQLLLTLAANARDAVVERGLMRIETRRAAGAVSRAASFSPGSAAGHILLSCSDDGSGMSAETRARAFEPFFTTKALGVGVGLGLALVHGIVERAGGRIELASKPGEGTSFQLRLPLAPDGLASDGAANDVRALSLDEATLAGASILVIEDEPLIRSTIAHHLRLLGCEVHEAPSFDGAVAQLRARASSLRLVISDVVLDRDARALQIETEVRRHAPNLRLLFMSAHPAAVLFRNNWLELGSRVLEKPFTADQLKQAVLRSLL